MAATKRMPRRMTEPPRRSVPPEWAACLWGCRPFGPLVLGAWFCVRPDHGPRTDQDPRTRAQGLPRAHTHADRKAASAGGGELEVLAVVRVGQVLDGEVQAELIAAAHKGHAPAETLHGKAVEREQVLGDAERRGQEGRR